MHTKNEASDQTPECPIASNFSPTWNAYFDTRRSVSCPSRNATFNVYLAGSAGPVVLCLHGGGYTGLTWALLALNLKGSCQIVAPDLRGHGLTISENDLDLSAETLAADVAALWNELFCTTTELGSPPPPPPPTLIVGHSMGGAIAVHTASLLHNTPSTATDSSATNNTNNNNNISNVSSHIPTLEGIVVIDVVEGTAMSSLPFMKTVLQKRPGSFPSPSAAVEWALETGFSRNAEAAAISVPAMLKRRRGASSSGGITADAAKEAAVAAANAAWNTTSSGNSRKMCTSAASELEPISEQSQSQQQQQPSRAPPPTAPPPPPESGRPPRPPTSNESTSKLSSSTFSLKTSFGTIGAWVWRTPLEESASYWEGWYRGLSTLYLNLKIPKMLILAGTDRLDKELTIGQMQGKFQLVLLSRAGHAVHEDEAGEVSAAVRGFIQRFQIGVADKRLGVPTGSGGSGSLFRVPENPKTLVLPKSSENSNSAGSSRFKPPELAPELEDNTLS